MTDPTRLLRGGATDFERMLLGAAIRERPSRLQRQRMRRVIGFAQFGFLASTAKAMAGFAHHIVVVTAVATAVVGSASTPIVTLPRDTPMPAAASSASGIASSKAVRGTNAAPVGEPPNTPEDAPVAAQDFGQDPTAEQKPELRPRPVASARNPSELRDEIALMDQARTALRQGSPSRALSALSQYRARFPRGSFGQEARVLSIEALFVSGNRSRAVAEAQAFLAKNPTSPHADRLRRMIGVASGER